MYCKGKAFPYKKQIPATIRLKGLVFAVYMRH